MDDLCRLPVVDQIGDYEFIYRIGLEDGVEVVTLVVAAELGYQL